MASYLVGCAPAGPIILTAMYHAPDDERAFSAEGARIRFTVLDQRADQRYLGTTGAGQRIELDRPGTDIVEDAFLQALSAMGFVLSEDAETVYQVQIRDMTTVMSVAFSDAMARANVSLHIDVLSDGEILGSKRVGGRYYVNLKLSSSNQQNAGYALSRALGNAVAKAVNDPQLFGLASGHLKSVTPE